MAIITRSVLSTDWVRIKASATEGDVYVDLTVDLVELAFPVTGVKPVTGDWQTGEWELTDQDGKYWARVLVGPAGFPLAVGTYDVYIRVHDVPAVPVDLRGQIRII